jgi:hypothetical protein
MFMPSLTFGMLHAADAYVTIPMRALLNGARIILQVTVYILRSGNSPSPNMLLLRTACHMNLFHAITSTFFLVAQAAAMAGKRHAP